MIYWKRHDKASENERKKVHNIGEYVKVIPEELDFDPAQKKSDFIKSTNHKAKKWLSTFLRYAAVIISLFGLTYFYSIWSDSSDLDNTFSHTPVDVVTLTLDDGDQVKLDVKKEKKVRDKDENLISNQVKNTLSYGKVKSEKLNKLVYNNLAIPNGQTFKLKLSDGTKVHLNAGSSLRYPIAFIKGQPRIVYLDGEGYFEVSKDTGDPFIVNAHALSTEVYGTQFNISGYKIDNDTQVVLIEGLIGVSVDRNTSIKPTVLIPGQMATVGESDLQPSIEIVNVKNHTCWRNGMLFFRAASFEQIMKKLERHFNVVVDLKYKEIANHKFSASFDKETVEQILIYLRNSTPFSYEIKGNNITIYKPKKQ